MRILIVSALAWAMLSAQEPTFRANVPVVLVPVTVTDNKGRFVDGLTAADFALLEDGRPKEFRMDAADAVVAPLAIVIAVQTDDLSATANLKVRKVGSLIQPLITGDRGRAAVLGYGDAPVVLTDFTRDPNLIEAAFLRTAASQGGDAARQIDAVAEAAQMLAARPANERKILILIGESKDRGSKTRLAAALRLLERDAVLVYAATWSPYETAFTTRGTDMPQSGGDSADLLAGLQELGRLAKRDSANTLVKATGGEKLSFATLKGLEKSLTRMGEELHSQYLLSFPASGVEPGFHKLEVRVVSRGGLGVRARPGYWFGDIPGPKEQGQGQAPAP
ncbi:MAG: VWA domain-containing protein [Bryobacteraceae bacterium]